MFCQLWNFLVIETQENLSVLNLVRIEDMEKKPAIEIF